MGYQGKLLRVNLSKGSSQVEEIPAAIRKDYVGGSGFGIKYLWDEVPPDCDPLGPANKLIFATGPLTATPVEASGRAVVVSKSPLTGLFGDAHSGSEWGPALKKAGYDVLIIEGMAKKFCYIFISDDHVEILSAKKLKKKTTSEMLEWVWATHGRAKDLLNSKGYTRVASIGPAGEQLSPIACIMADKHRAFGRCGFGAVMGSKNLKAIVVQGTRDVPVTQPEAFQALNETITAKLEAADVTGSALKENGTPVLVAILYEMGLLPVKNFSTTQLENIERLFTDNLKQLDGWKAFGCSDYCNVMKCGKYVNIGDQQMVVPEYESLFSIGSNCGITDFEAITKVNRACNEYGLDTISTGNAIAYAMEYSERVKPVKLKSTGPLQFGNAAAILEAVELMGRRKKTGKDLLLGVQRLAEKWDYLDGAVTVKGMSLPAYDPRGLRGQALSYVTSTRGGDHLKAYLIAPEVLGTTPEKKDPLTEEGKVDLTILLQDASAVLDSLLVCKFWALGMVENGLSLEDIVAILNADVGASYSLEDLLQVGNRIYTLERAYNIKCGLDASKDVLPKRLRAPLPDGPHQGQVSDPGNLLQTYYQSRGWSATGIPTPDKLQALGIS